MKYAYFFTCADEMNVVRSFTLPNKANAFVPGDLINSQEDGNGNVYKITRVCDPIPFRSLLLMAVIIWVDKA
jgi:hypothetical protein